MTDTDHDPNLDEFLVAYEADDNEWWRTSSGQHQNWFEEAVDRWRAAAAEVERLQADVTRLVQAAHAVCDWWADDDPITGGGEAPIIELGRVAWTVSPAPTEGP